ncbi:MAG: sigma-70 family RNA polymerase sigma factor [Lewinellaceae bacterium]|nr:sigma-70 family RNA polymerase sigma factor [Lewinellaceae bacterium]
MPTEAEWKLAARGNQPESSDYSWGGGFVRNSKGCYLGNFKVDQLEKGKPLATCLSSDGGAFPVGVNTYFPNSFGLYNVHGNVAEMINEKGFAMGGSWRDAPLDCTLNAKQSFQAPAPHIGFRVFMEVIEGIKTKKVLFRTPNYSSLSDEDLLRHITRGAEDAFSELYRRYGVRMHRFFCRMRRNETVRADDFTQELFLKIIEKPEAFDPNRRFSSWIYTVAGNMCKNEYRRQESRPTTSQLPEMPHHAALPERLDHLLFSSKLELALEDLNPDQRQCFLLRYQEDCTMREIAEIMDCPEGTVRSRLFYALRQLAEQLKIFQIV